jgi:preprotein translocase subunit SecA
VDEVDSILIDEARTPLVISGSTEDKSDQYYVCNKFVKELGKNDYELDEKNKNVMLSEEGIDKIEKISKTYGILKNNNFYDPQNINLVHHINQALRANLLFSKDTDYIIRDNKIQLIDEFTGRVLEGRRFSDGLHQALEAKEKVEIQSENQTLASITYQNYFRLYKKLSGMTGTAITEAEEFYDIYKLKTVSIPTNVPMIRTDLNDQIFRTEKEKNKAIIEKIEECKKNNQPVLVGTTSIEKSEKISRLLNEKKINHNVLNAKHHEKEAIIIAEAGKLGSATIATNMAGRGTDIQLGGNLNYLNKELEKEKELILKEKNEVKNKGGLFVIGTERHESRRIDNQLRGRSGRQGDPGKSIFYVSLEDDLMRIFGSESIDTIMKKFGLKENESIDHPWINKALERAQQRVEARNFDIRKTLLKFDDVMNDQRKVIFEQRKNVLKSNNINKIINSFLEDIIKNFSHEKTIYMRENQLDSFKTKIKPILGKSINEQEFTNIVKKKNEEFENTIKERFNEIRNKRSKAIQETTNLELEKRIFLQTVDFLWRSHLQHLEHLRQVVGLRGYAQKDPLEEFRREAFKLFEDLLNKIKIDFITFLNNLEIVSQENEPIKNLNKLKKGLENNPKCLLRIRKNEKISRNEKCPATGKKYKHCCGAL